MSQEGSYLLAVLSDWDPMTFYFAWYIREPTTFKKCILSDKGRECALRVGSQQKIFPTSSYNEGFHHAAFHFEALWKKPDYWEV